MTEKAAEEKNRVHPLADGGEVRLHKSAGQWYVVRSYACPEENSPDTERVSSYDEGLDVLAEILGNDIMERD